MQTSCELKDIFFLFPKRNIFIPWFKNIVICMVLKFLNAKWTTVLIGKKKNLNFYMEGRLQRIAKKCTRLNWHKVLNHFNFNVVFKLFKKIHFSSTKAWELKVWPKSFILHRKKCGICNVFCYNFNLSYKGQTKEIFIFS